MERVPTMRKCFVAPRVVLAMLIISPLVRPQTAPPRSGTAKEQESAPTSPEPIYFDDWGHPITPIAKGQKAALAPRHDISGIWDPGMNPTQVLGTLGASAMPDDGKPEHQLPYTPLGREALNRTKPSNGVRSVLPADTNDPVVYCDPQGMPREDLYELRTTQVLQTPQSVFLLDERTWVDRAGRPHSGDLRVEERFHRVDHDHLELTVKINDPKMYTKPWVALDKARFQLQTRDYDVREMICSPTDFAEYNKLIGNPASDKDGR